MATARGLIASGVAVGDRIAIMSRTRYEWTLLDFAAWAIGAVPVPVYETSSAKQLQWICSDAGVNILVVETSAHLAVAQEAARDLPDLREVLVLDDDALSTLATRGANTDPHEVTQRSVAVTGGDLATII